MKKIVFTFCLILGGLAANAQPNNPSNPVPLDGGLSLLVAAGAAYGLKKYKDSRADN